MKTMRKLIQCLACLLVVAGCASGGGDKPDEERERARLLTEKQLYQRVQTLLDDEFYDLAVKNLQLLESRFPFGAYADQAQLEIIYAYYQNADRDAAVAAAERFLRLHPDHPDADYAGYMMGLANYSLKPGFLSRFYQHDHAARDVEPARQSFRDFAEFLRRHPDSPYAADARVRMIHIRHVLARHELLVANYYLERRAYTAAINRAKTVLESYQGSDSVADALAILAYGYHRLSLPQLAEDNIAVLRANFPDHPTLDESGAFRYGADFDFSQRSWLNRASRGLFDAPRAPQFDSRGSAENGAKNRAKSGGQTAVKRD